VKRLSFLVALLLGMVVLVACPRGSVEGPLAAPTNVQATPGSGEIVLTWQDNSTAEEGFRIYRKLETDEAFPTDFLDETPPDTETYTDTLVSSAETYVYQVRAFAGSSEGELSRASNAAQPTLAENKVTLRVNRDENSRGQGVITSSPIGIECINRPEQNPGACSFDFDIGTTVTLTASPDAENGSVFSGFSGACVTTALTCEITMDTAKEVTATFNPAQPGLTVQVSGEGRVFDRTTPDQGGPYINCSSDGGDCSETVYWPVGSRVDLFAEEASGYVFSGWSDNCDLNEDDTPADRCIFRLGSSTVISATFIENVGPPTVDLTAAPNPLSPTATTVRLIWDVDDRGSSQPTTLELNDDSNDVTSPSLAGKGLEDFVDVSIPTNVTSVTFELRAKNFFSPDGVTDTVTVTRGSLPTVTLNEPSPPSLPFGGGVVTFTWTDSNAATLTLDRDPGTPIDVTGEDDNSYTLPAPQTVTTTYTLVAENQFTGDSPVRSEPRTVTVAELALPTIDSFTSAPAASPTGDPNVSTVTVTLGTSVSLAWSVTGAAANGVRLNGDPVDPVDDSFDVTPTEVGSVDYTLTARNASGAATPKTITVTANQPAEAPNATFSLTLPTDISGSYTLNWSATGTTPIDFTLQENTGIPENVNSLNRTKLVKPTATTTYTLNATNIAGSDPSPPDPITITEPTAVLTADPTSTTGTESVTLDWSTSTGTGPAAFTLNTSIDGGATFTSQSVSGTSTTRTPDVPTIYTITMITPVGAVTSSQVPVTVTPPVEAPSIESFTPTPEQIILGSSSTLAWTVTGTEPITINLLENGVLLEEDLALVGSLPVTPASEGDYVYTLTAENGTRDDKEERTVTVEEDDDDDER
jgi:hypothetical protein